MDTTPATEVFVGRSSGRTGSTRPPRALVGAGLLAAFTAMSATTLAAALARALGVDFEVPAGGQQIPLSGIAVVTGCCSLVGVGIAVALQRWSGRPAERFVWTSASLTTLSLVPPVVAGADAATTTALVGLHLVAAAVMIPTLALRLRTGTGADGAPAQPPEGPSESASGRWSGRHS